MAAMTILDEIQTNIRQHAEGAGRRGLPGGLEHAAPLGPGSPGGPVLDAEGRLLGANPTRLGEGFYLAIPADEALRAQAVALARGESVAPPQLGIAIASRPVAKRLRRAVGLPDTEGLLIQQVTEDSPAARADLSSGHLIVAAAGQPVGGPDALFDALQGARQGGTLEVRVVRRADQRTVQVVFTPELEGKRRTPASAVPTPT